MTPALRGIDLTDSYVMSWKEQASALVSVISFSLWPESPSYQEPKKDEWTCYRTGILRFDGITAIEGLKNESEVKFTIDPDGTKDFGTFDSFQESPGGIRLSGDFGDVFVRCASWKGDIK